MNALASWNMLRWNQLNEVEELRDTLGRLFCPPQVRSRDDQQLLSVPEWAPLVDISEDREEYLIKAELPEVMKEDVKVTLEDGALTITGARNQDPEENGKQYHRIERAYGSFRRSFSLPDDASPAKVTANFKDGVLRVHLPKNGKARLAASADKLLLRVRDRQGTSAVPRSAPKKSKRDQIAKNAQNSSRKTKHQNKRTQT